EENVWAIRESGLGATAFVPGKGHTWEGWEDSAVDPKHLGKYLRELRKLLDKYGYSGDLYGHFGQACVHTRNNFGLESAAGIAKFRSYLDEAAALCIKYNRSLSGEHRDGQTRVAARGCCSRCSRGRPFRRAGTTRSSRTHSISVWPAKGAKAIAPSTWTWPRTNPNSCRTTTHASCDRSRRTRWDGSTGGHEWPR